MPAERSDEPTTILRADDDTNNVTSEQPNEPHANDAPLIAATTIRLPPVQLPQFDGDYLKWRQFRDLFIELVDKQPIPSCQKMCHLKSSLCGEAAALIHHLTSSNNYEAAWHIISERYENKRLLVNTSIRKLLSQPPSISEHAASIKLLHDTTQECILSLQGLGVSTESWDPILIYILTQQMSKTTHALWEQSLSNPRQLPSLDEFLTFLKLRFQSLEALGSRPIKDQINQSRQKLQHALSASLPTGRNCIICREHHPLFRCVKFLQMTPKERLNAVQRAKLCVNCLKGEHKASSCTSGTCSKCQRKHNTLLHLESQEAIRSSIVTNTATTAQNNCHQQSTALSAAQASAKKEYVILSSAIVKIIGNNGQEIECRAILDSGSQVNLLTERVARRLGLSLQSTSMMIEGIGSGRKESRRRVNVKLQSRTGTYSTRLEAFILPNIVSQQPAQQLDISNWELPRNIVLADPRFNYPGDVDVLIGAEFFYNVLTKGQNTV